MMKIIIHIFFLPADRHGWRDCLHIFVETIFVFFEIDYVRGLVIVVVNMMYKKLKRRVSHFGIICLR